MRIGLSIARQSLDDEFNAEAQHRANVDWAWAQRIFIPQHLQLTDNKTSGESPDRETLVWVQRQVETGVAEFDDVVAYDKRRFGRFDDSDALPAFRYMLTKKDKRLLFVNDTNPREVKKEYRAGAAICDLLENQRAGEERTELREKMRRAVMRHLMGGFFVGSAAPYGTEKKLISDQTRLIRSIPKQRFEGGANLRIHAKDHSFTLAWHEEDSRTLDAVRYIFSRLSMKRGPGYAGLCRELEKLGYPPPGKRWDRGSIIRIARNPIYCGDYVHGWTWAGVPTPVTEIDENSTGPVILPNFMSDPPVTRETFEVVQDMLDRRSADARRARTHSPDFLFSTILQCRHCGGTFSGQTGQSVGREKRRYRHQQIKPSRENMSDQARRIRNCPCPKHFVHEADVESAVLGAIVNALQEPSLTGQLESAMLVLCNPDRPSVLSGELDKAKVELERAVSQVERAFRMVGEMEDTEDPDTKTAAKNFLEVSKREVRRARARQEHLQQRSNVDQDALRQKVEQTLKTLPNILNRLAEKNRPTLKDLLRQVVENIWIDLATGEIQIILRLSPCQ